MFHHPQQHYHWFEIMLHTKNQLPVYPGSGSIAVSQQNNVDKSLYNTNDCLLLFDSLVLFMFLHVAYPTANCTNCTQIQTGTNKKLCPVSFNSRLVTDGFKPNAVFNKATPVKSSNQV